MDFVFKELLVLELLEQLFSVYPILVQSLTKRLSVSSSLNPYLNKLLLLLLLLQ